MVINIAIVSVLFVSGAVNTCDISINSLNLEALSGSCLLIPCNFSVKEGYRFPGGTNAGAVWIKTKPQFESENSDFVVFNSSRTTPNYPMTITGDLSQRNCTTVFNDLKTEYTGRYYFRVEDGNFRSTASCDSVYINMTDNPWTPSISEKKEKDDSVTISCSAVTPCPHSPPKLTWDKHQDSVIVMETNSDGTLTTTTRLTLTESFNGNLTCSAAYPVSGGVKTAQTTITLNVTYTNSGSTQSFVKWVPALCAIIVIALIAVIVYVWRVKQRRPSSGPASVKIHEGLELQEPAPTEDDGVHYEDVRFNQWRAKSKPISEEQDTVYSQVKVSPANCTAKATEMLDTYAEIQK